MKKRFWKYLGIRKGLIQLECPKCGHVKNIMKLAPKNPNRCTVCCSDFWYPEELFEKIVKSAQSDLKHGGV